MKREKSGPIWEGKDSTITNTKIAWVVHECRKVRVKISPSERLKGALLGEDLIHIDFQELFQLFNPDTLDKSLVSYYVL
jgi:hypothetical protein